MARWREAMNLVNRNQGYPMLKLIETMSDVAKVVLDRSVSTSQLHPKDKNYWISYDFKYLVCEKPESLHKNQLHKVGVKNQVSPESGYSGNDSDDHNSISSEKPSSDETTLTLADEQEAIPLAALDKMVKCDRKDLLIHPLSSALLKSRWDSYGSLVFKLNTLAYVIFLIFLTSAVALVTETGMPNTNATRNQTHIQEKTLSSFGRVSQVIVVIFGILQLIKEIVQMFQLRLNYFADFTNYMEWTLYITSILFVAPVGTVEQDSYRMEVGAVAIFLAWINLLLYIQRIDVIGIYIVMFLEVLKTLIVVTSVFFVFIVAFGLTFYVLLYPTGELYFVTIPRSFLKMAEYLLGELEFEFYIDRADMPYPGLTWVIVLIMVIFLPIIFMNLLIGLAVGDIEGVRKNAQLKRLAMQVELHMEAERKLPKSLQKRLCKETLKEYPNRCCNHWENALLDISQVSNLLPAFEESESSQGIADLREKFDRTQMKYDT
jgi:transient receptor potential cation channel subfamily A protein 1